MTLLAAAEFLEAGLAIAALIVLSIWSLRTPATSAYGGQDVSPGLACGGWYIPFGNFVVPFVQLRRVPVSGPAADGINWWQGLFIAESVAGVSFQRLGDIESASSPDDFLNRMSGQIGLAALTAILLTATAYVAMRATQATSRGADGAELSAGRPRSARRWQ